MTLGTLLFNLPECLLSEILIEWMSIKEIGQLDSAFCSKSLRSKLVEFLDSDAVIFCNMGYYWYTSWASMFQKWLQLRRIRFSKFA